MKRFLYGFLLLMCVGFVACEKAPTQENGQLEPPKDNPEMAPVPEGQMWEFKRFDYLFNDEVVYSQEYFGYHMYCDTYIKVFCNESNLTLFKGYNANGYNANVVPYSVIGDYIYVEKVGGSSAFRFKIAEKNDASVKLQYWVRSGSIAPPEAYEKEVFGVYKGITIFGTLYDTYYIVDGYQYRCGTQMKNGGIDFCYDSDMLIYELVEE